MCRLAGCAVPNIPPWQCLRRPQSPVPPLCRCAHPLTCCLAVGPPMAGGQQAHFLGAGHRLQRAARRGKGAPRLQSQLGPEGHLWGVVVLGTICIQRQSSVAQRIQLCSILLRGQGRTRVQRIVRLHACASLHDTHQRTRSNVLFVRDRITLPHYGGSPGGFESGTDHEAGMRSLSSAACMPEPVHAKYASKGCYTLRTSILIACRGCILLAQMLLRLGDDSPACLAFPMPLWARPDAPVV